MGKKGNYAFIVGLMAGLAAGFYLHSTHGQKMKKKIKKKFREAESFSAAKNAFKEYVESLTKNQSGQESRPSEEDKKDSEEMYGV
jgi:hypothetical protein